jgi:hypothetical protein
MLNDRLAVFDYNVSWEPGIAGLAPLVELVNVEAEALVEVRVHHEAYDAARKPAVAVLRHLPAIDDTLADDVAQELSSFDYRWQPRLDELGPLDDRARQLASFRYGALLFHSCAESISDRRQRLDQRAEHVLDAKRARVMLAISLAPSGSLGLEEAPLLGGLRRVEDAADGAVAAVELKAPTFLPYLLSREPRNPGELMRLALKEREGGTVRSYREWRRELLADLADGRVRTRTRRDLRVIADEIHRRTKRDAAVSLHLARTTADVRSRRRDSCNRTSGMRYSTMPANPLRVLQPPKRRRSRPRSALTMVAAASVDVSVSVNGRLGRERHLLPEIAMSLASTPLAHRWVRQEQHQSFRGGLARPSGYIPGRQWTRLISSGAGRTRAGVAHGNAQPRAAAISRPAAQT